MLVSCIMALNVTVLSPYAETGLITRTEKTWNKVYFGQYKILNAYSVFVYLRCVFETVITTVYVSSTEDDDSKCRNDQQRASIPRIMLLGFQSI